MQEKASQANQTTQKNTPKAKLSKYHTQLAIKKTKSSQDLWNMVTKPKLWAWNLEEGSKMQNKCIEKYPVLL